MKYKAEENVFFLTGEEAIELAFRRSLTFYLPEDDGMLRRADNATVKALSEDAVRETLVHSFELLGYNFKTELSCDYFDDAFAVFVYTLPHSPSDLSKEELKRARGYAFLFAHAWREKTQRIPTIKLIFINTETQEKYVHDERPSAKMLDKFFAKSAAHLVNYAHEEEERVCVRIPSMQKMRFPYKTLRQGQSDIIESVYRTVKRKRRLFTCAPTGTGKTVSVLYGAVRAMGEGLCDKIFYLTPKTTTGLAVADTLDAFAKAGAKIRCVQIIAKDRICRRGTVCRSDRRACPYTCVSNEREDEAQKALLDLEKTTVTYQDIRKVADVFGVCPYELSLDFSMKCDVIVCDYNYLFDMHSYLRRYFDEKGRYTFLIDEAHNLPSRVRDAYSVKLTQSDFSAPDGFLPGNLKDTLDKCKGEFCKTVNLYLKDSMRKSPDGKTVGAEKRCECPGQISHAVRTALDAVNKALKVKDKYGNPELPTEALNSLRSVKYKLSAARDILFAYDTRYVTFIENTGDEMSAELCLLDPSKVIREHLDLGESAVMFSATLQPTDYFREILGGEKNDEVIDAPSPFDPDRLCITVMDKIRTSYSSREESISDVCDVIYETVSAKEGNYMVFSPSFAYSAQIYRAFRETYPEIEVIYQKRDMTQREKNAFLERFKSADSPVLGFCVLGGIYSEGIDLYGESLIGAIIVGVGIPQISNEREALKEYYNDISDNGTEYAYINPGMNRVFQAAGRVIRRDDDRGVIVLIDERFSERVYRKIFPPHWHGLRYAGDTEALASLLFDFWEGADTPET